MKPRIGLVHSDERSFYWRLSARENLRFFARLYDVPAAKIESRIAELLELVGMTAQADRPFSTYSAGMKQRIAIVRAMRVGSPPSNGTLHMARSGGSGSCAGFGTSPCRLGAPPRTNTTRDPSGVKTREPSSCPSSP